MQSKLHDNGLVRPQEPLNTEQQFLFLQATTSIKDCNNPATPTAVCAEPVTGKICGGDSGGPTVADLDGDGRWVLYGINSFGGYPCGKGGDGYEDVSQWTDTILDKITYENNLLQIVQESNPIKF